MKHTTSTTGRRQRRTRLVRAAFRGITRYYEAPTGAASEREIPCKHRLTRLPWRGRWLQYERATGNAVTDGSLLACLENLPWNRRSAPPKSGHASTPRLRGSRNPKDTGPVSMLGSGLAVDAPRERVHP